MEQPAIVPLGLVTMTRGVANLKETDEAFSKWIMKCLCRHQTGDWGNLGEEDKRENDYSFTRRLRIFSAYEEGSFPKIWIITEADRSSTTILFPDEY